MDGLNSWLMEEIMRENDPGLIQEFLELQHSLFRVNCEKYIQSEKFLPLMDMIIELYKNLNTMDIQKETEKFWYASFQ